MREEEVQQGGKILRFEPSNCNEITSSPFFMKYFKDVNCLGFCQRVQEVGYHKHLTGIFSLTLKEDKITIARTNFMFSVDAISQAIGIPNHGENWFKGMNLDLEEYKPYLKSQSSSLIGFPIQILVGEICTIDEGCHEVLHV